MVTKQCTRCGERKSLDQFDYRLRKQGIRQSQCKVCRTSHENARFAGSGELRETKRAYNRQYKEKTQAAKREIIWQHLLSHPCVDCGEANPLVLDFDHRDPNQKQYGIPSLLWGGHKLSTFEAELAKCDVRCANCHRIKSMKEQSSWKIRRAKTGG